jgi:hypothetical protein
MVLIFLEEKRSKKIEMFQYYKKILSTSLRISRPNQRHMKDVEFPKKFEITGPYFCQQALSTSANSATVLGSIPASNDAVESEIQ